MHPTLVHADTFFIQTFGIGCAALLTPIDPSAPQGASLRGTALWLAIRRARESDDASVPLGAWVRQLKRAAWGEVAAATLNAIAQRSKDLQLAAWMAEAMLHEHGFEGFAASIALIDALCEHYWDVMYPLIVDGDLEHRANLFRWLNEKLVIPVRLVPLTAYAALAPQGDAATADTDAAYTWSDCEQLRRQQQAKLAGAQSGGGDDADHIDPERFASALANTSNEAWLAQYDALDWAIRSLTKLGATLDRVFDGDAPGLGTLRGVLEQIQAFVAAQLAQRGVATEPDAPAAPAALDEGRTAVGVRDIGAPGSAPMIRASLEDDEPVASPVAPPQPPQGEAPSPAASGAPAAEPPQDARKRAYAQLTDAANTLASIEPHSPVPYLIRRAVEWGALNTAQLYHELFIEGRGQLNVFQLLGLEMPHEEEGQ
jgi:type VI secretion system protein ImpA